MRRFIRYLYEYGQGKKVRNVGFVNVEQDGTETTVHIHGKGLRISGEDALKLYLFWEQDGRNTGVYQGDVDFMGPAVNYRLRYTPEDTGSTENYDAVGGIILKDRNGRTFAAVWEEEPADVEKIPCGTMQEVSDEEKPVVTRPVPVEDGRKTEEKKESAQAGKMQTGTENEETNTGTEAKRAPDDAEVSVQEEWEDTCPWKVTKIKREEISGLPRCEWRLANNNFLLHGYHNYHHLVLLDDGSVLRIGVPGVYHVKEARAAAGFGFPEFIGADETGIALDGEESSDEEHFGYWCRQVRRPVR